MLLPPRPPFVEGCLSTTAPRLDLNPQCLHLSSRNTGSQSISILVAPRLHAKPSLPRLLLPALVSGSQLVSTNGARPLELSSSSVGPMRTFPRLSHSPHRITFLRHLGKDLLL
ncbi:hypothetical protein Mapa_014207 [Marchantia paleacea]|nr:hypothetical protein Mapa_014207 [Marchantia paleacea]